MARASTSSSTLPDEELAVRIDASRFEQVLFNLVINARDAMPRGGAIRIEADIADIDAAYAASRPGLAPGCHVRLSVSDEGSGMSPETVASAFDPFFTTKEAGEGSGLGLSTVYGIVREAGGDTKIYSEPDVGTTVTVTLPCATGEHSAIAKAARCSVHASTGLSAVLAEDEEPLRRAAARMLRDAGYEVVEAADGATALALATDGAHSIDLVLTDVMMPAMTGTELAAQLRSERPDLPLLMMSGYVSRNGPAGRSAIETTTGFWPSLSAKPTCSRRLRRRSAMPEVLIVDDEELIGRWARRVLETNGYSCAVAIDGPRARELMALQGFDCVLLDVHLPGESGLELLAEIRAAIPTGPSSCSPARAIRAPR